MQNYPAKIEVVEDGRSIIMIDCGNDFQGATECLKRIVLAFKGLDYLEEWEEKSWVILISIRNLPARLSLQADDRVGFKLTRRAGIDLV